MNSSNTLLITLILALVALIVSIGNSIYFNLQLKKMRHHEELDYYQDDQENENQADARKAPLRPPLGLRPDSTIMGETRIEWMNQITEFSEELIKETPLIFKASRLIIEQNIAIKKEMATADTHHIKTEQISLYNTSVEEFKVIMSKLRLTFFGDKKNAEILSLLKKIDRLVEREYDAQIHSDMSQHDALVEKYDQSLEEYVELTRKLLAIEWEKIKRGL